MAKVYKVEMYILDYNEEIQSPNHLDDILEDFGYRRWLSVHTASIKESEEFEWDDDLKINKTNATTEDYEEYLKG